MSRCRNCGVDLDRKDEFDEDEPALTTKQSADEGPAAASEAPVAAGGADATAAEDSPGNSSSPPSEKRSGESTVASKKSLSWDNAFRRIRKGLPV